jgi:hypothetical protein
MLSVITLHGLRIVWAAQRATVVADLAAAMAEADGLVHATAVGYREQHQRL